MCILLYVKLIQCSGIPYIYGQLEEGAMVYVHFAICETYVVQWYSIDVWSIGGGGTSALTIYAFCYMFNLFSVVVFYKSMVNWRRGEVRVYLGVVVFHRCMIDWRRRQLI